MIICNKIKNIFNLAENVVNKFVIVVLTLYYQALKSLFYPWEIRVQHWQVSSEEFVQVVEIHWGNQEISEADKVFWMSYVLVDVFYPYIACVVTSYSRVNNVSQIADFLLKSSLSLLISLWLLCLVIKIARGFT